MTKFSDLKLDPKVLKAVEEAGYETPTPIQEGAIPPALEGRDVLGIAQTGTGKTASFTLPMITLLKRGRARAMMPRSLVLCPTRELAAQVAENFDTYARHTKLTKALLIGGVSFGEQDKLIGRGVDVLIATPGRLLDHFERGKLILADVKVMVVDEADRMLDMGFIPDIERIFGLTNPLVRQTLFFSATMPPEIERLTRTFLTNPARVEVARQATASETITQGVVQFKPSRKDRAASEKRGVLRDLIAAEGNDLRNAIIFCNRKVDVDVVAKSLKKHGLDAAAIHGDLDQSQRTRTLDAFRDGTLKFLVASDVAARGLDIPNVSHVFNFDVPGHAEDYVHRIGRTGRAGREGRAFTIATTPGDDKALDAIEQMIGRDVPRVDRPGRADGVKPAPPEADVDAPEGKAEARPARSRRSRSRKKADAAAPAAAPAEEATAAAVEGAPAAESATVEADRAEPEPSEAERAEPPRPQSPASGGRRSSSRGGRGRRSDDEPVVGMGDHVPDFLLRSFA
ncbi:ATP-dependent helicase [Rhodovulum sp. 12E13]|uniref:DEAD/DEAH box helicase n=1 Tax=Rhodovulum sp. 12E13 TaxID=2203891 RepID=UPI000E14815B|nr:DEAD/DEAH box helicase [Rhodovulum sp. 12E13]RDC71901.1 ATP-dependent helicase [Rhodovulum sp. 12E13]